MNQTATRQPAVVKFQRSEAGRFATLPPDAEAPASRKTTPQLVESSPLNEFLSNQLLAALPGDEFARLLPHLEPVTLRAGEDLYHYGDKQSFAYFPESVVIAQIHTLADGNTTEAAMIGREGAVGLWTIFGADRPSYWTRVLLGGTALKIEAQVFQAEFRQGRHLQQSVLRYASVRMSQLSQRAVCNGRHLVEERFCSWLLMLQDRTGDHSLPLTHEQIAGHLGTRRAGITIAAAALRDKGILDCGRGRIRILDRKALESISCECYRTLGGKAVFMSES